MTDPCHAPILYHVNLNLNLHGLVSIENFSKSAILLKAASEIIHQEDIVRRSH